MNEWPVRVDGDHNLRELFRQGVTQPVAGRLQVGLQHWRLVHRVHAVGLPDADVEHERAVDDQHRLRTDRIDGTDLRYDVGGREIRAVRGGADHLLRNPNLWHGPRIFHQRVAGTGGHSQPDDGGTEDGFTASRKQQGDGTEEDEKFFHAQSINTHNLAFSSENNPKIHLTRTCSFGFIVIT